MLLLFARMSNDLLEFDRAGTLRALHHKKGQIVIVRSIFFLFCAFIISVCVNFVFTFELLIIEWKEKMLQIREEFFTRVNGECATYDANFNPCNKLA